MRCRAERLVQVIQHFIKMLLRRLRCNILLNSYLIASPAEDAELFKVKAAFKVEATYREKVALLTKYLDD